MGAAYSSFQREQDKIAVLRNRLDEFEKEKALAEEEKLSEPWRKFERKWDWNNEFRTKLVADVKSFKTFGDAEYTKLLILGPIMAGKSSFLNSVASIDKDRIAQPNTAGGQQLDSMTRKLQQYIPKKHLECQVHLMDTMGIEDSQDNERGFNLEDVKYLIRGNISPEYQFNPEHHINPDSDPNFISNPTLKDRPQCTALVLDSCLFYPCMALNAVLEQKLRQLKKFILEEDVPIVVILTKIDLLCEAENISITDIYKNRRIGSIVDTVHERFGVPKMNIYLVQNYSKEHGLEDNLDILLLLAFRGMLHIAQDRLEKIEDQKKK